MTPDQFIADVVKMLEIQRANGRTIKKISVSAVFHPDGRTVAEMTWPVPNASKPTKEQKQR